MKKIKFWFKLSVTLLILFMDQAKSKLLSLKDPDNPDVIFHDKDKSDYYSINMDENVKGRIFYVEVDGTDNNPHFSANGDSTSCDSFSYKNDMERVNETFFSFNLTVGLDYEQSECRHVYGQISQQSNTLKFTILINNIDDNKPRIEVVDCIMKENEYITLETTKCIFNMTDEDGMMNFTNFKVYHNQDESDIFTLDFYQRKPNNNEYSARIALFLKENIQLDYETTIFYLLNLEAKQTFTESTSPQVVNVEDMPDMPPIWSNYFTAKEFEENTEQMFRFRAQDGDVGINNKILYKILNQTCNECAKFPDESIGDLKVRAIDRETEGDNIKVSIEALEFDGSNSSIVTVTFMIIDQDDNKPSIKMPNKIVNGWYCFKIDEGWKDEVFRFNVFDPDLSDYGTFNLNLVDIGSNVKYTEAFQIIPNSGYQSGIFELKVIDSKILDYENPTWKSIKFKIEAVEKKNDTMSDEVSIRIDLKDLNDEWPIFCNESTSASVYENINSDDLIFDAMATDPDEGDRVTYRILKSIWGDKLRIDENGSVYLREGFHFDYETLTQVLITIQAEDLTKHVVSKILEISVLDVNDEPPQISVGKNRLSILENTDNGTSIPNLDIVGTDPDTKPKLEFSIDWIKSYIIKNSVEVDPKEAAWKCFSISTVEPEDNGKKVKADIKVNFCKPDFELYDTIIIALNLIDSLTDEGNNSTSGSVVINLIDENDNPPKFLKYSLEHLITTDGSKSPSIVGTIIATDVDLNSNITYSIEPINGTPNWLKINTKTGTIEVSPNVEIDDDEPKRNYLFYQAMAFDQKFLVTEEIKITLNDINDNKPQIKNKELSKSIPEKSKSKTFISNIKAVDIDRDEPFHQVQFKFNTNITKEANMLFSIDDNGLLQVDLRFNEILNRDCSECPQKYVIPIVAYDNPKGTEKNQQKVYFDFTVLLEDVNDNAPVIISGLSLEASENLNEGDQLNGILVAEDIDEKGPNSDVRFSVKGVTSSDNSHVDLTPDTFDIQTTDNKTAIIKLTNNLRGFYGSYNLTVETCDYGTPVQCRSNNTIRLDINKFNFEDPVFTYPSKQNLEIVLQTIQDINQDLVEFYDQILPKLEVEDNQGHKWRTHFTCKEEGATEKLFDISIKGTANNEGRLVIIREIRSEDLKKRHELVIEASVKDSQQKGEAKTNVSSTIFVTFLDKNAPPKFERNTFSFDIDENCLKDNIKIPEAKYGEKIDGYLNVYYSLYQGNKSVFSVEEDSGDISVLEALDYETAPFVGIKIEANNKKGSPNPNPLNESILFVSVKVNDLNDNVPQFNQREYRAALLTTSTSGSALVMLSVTDQDSYKDAKKFTYSLGKVTSHGKNIDKVTDPFRIDDLGKISPNFVVNYDMSGYFEFDVTVKDGPDKYGTILSNTVNVQVNIITDDELLDFLFANADKDLNGKYQNITDLIDKMLPEYKATIAYTAYDADRAETTAKIYFLDKNSVPVKADIIKSKLSDPVAFLKLIRELHEINISLINYTHNEAQEDSVSSLNVWLIVLTSISSLLLILMSTAFVFKYRALSRRLKNLSTTKFGSIDSGLNRQGIVAPNTNRNAAEGSNPIFNNRVKFVGNVDDDQYSIKSDDSGLFAVDNDNTFGYKEKSVKRY